MGRALLVNLIYASGRLGTRRVKTSHVYVIPVKKADSIFWQKCSRLSLVVIGLITNRTVNASLGSAVRLYSVITSVHFN